MTMYETSDLHKRVERYEAALDELRAAHQDIKNILLDQVLYERWQQLGAELGFALVQNAPAPNLAGQPPHDPNPLSHQMPQLSESWAG
jgi:hypothetical protein